MFVVKRDVGHKRRATKQRRRLMGPAFAGTTLECVATRVARNSYASPSVSNIAALIASAADLPAQTTNWNAG